MFGLTPPVEQLLSNNAPSKLARTCPLQGWLPAIFNCARRTTTALSWGFREQRGLLDATPHLFASAGGQFNSACLPQ